MDPSVGADVPRLRWLHLTDLHVGRSNESQAVAIRSLVTAIQIHAEQRPFDVVFLSGDLAYSGQAEEYEHFESLVLRPLKATPLCKNATFIAAPGNHDLDCDVGLPTVWSSLGAKRQESFFQLGDAGRKVRQSRAAAFENYLNFVKRQAILSVNPLEEPAALIQLKVRGELFNVVSVVTAFFSDKDTKDYQDAPAPTHAVRAVLQTRDEQSPPIILAHHPLSWFTPESERHLHTLIIEEEALYVNGHEHRVFARFSGRGLICLGFGAAYQARADAPPKPYYRNSFAICELADELHVQVTSWDSENGRWAPDLNLPGDFTDRSTRLPNGYRLPLPTTRLLNASGRASIAATIKADIRVDSSVWMAANEPMRWVAILSMIGELQEVSDIYSLPTQTMPMGHREFRVRDRRGTFLIHVVPGVGDVLNYEQLKSINTELDKQDYDGCIIATFGALSEEAQTLATQLRSKKRINVFSREDLTRAVLYSASSMHRLLARINPSTELATLLIRDEGLALIVQDRSAAQWFRVVDEAGSVLSEADEVVIRVREEVPTLKGVRYATTELGSQELQLATGQSVPFNRELYLEKCHEYFDEVKYAPLAALGFRFRKASLSEIYVSASADVNDSGGQTQNPSRVLSEFLDSLNVSKSQRDQLESQLRSRLGIDASAEVGAARQLYQRYNNVVVLGDPGSGKTCFVKHEILAYCKPPQGAGSWYEGHLPVYLSLAEAARLADGKTDLLAICEIVSSRRGIELPKSVILRALSEGRGAFFFDGLDEVGFLDVRIALMSEINSLITKYAERGNRFVLSTRPAALAPVDIPEGLTYIQLKGLSDDEMRVLAGRVLTIRVGADEPQELSPDESALIDRLLEDTRSNPGIARIAKNPLLLTLLVLIYANTGAVGARRHVIYTQAIKTLVSVRARETREQQISEADLRTRLGAIATAIFERRIAEIPRRSEVNRVLRGILRPGEADESANSAVDAFLQEVSEATGLLSIHSENGCGAEDLITFMHYSFLEYYAAAGLLTGDYLQGLGAIAENPRWKEVLTLLFGILSERGDVTPALIAILGHASDTEHITNSRLLLALECAAECDVPPEAAQHKLFDALSYSVSQGAGRVSGELREALAANAAVFLQGSGRILEEHLLRGLTSQDALVVGSFMDLVSRLGSEVTLSQKIVDASVRAASYSEAVTRAAVLRAISRRPELRTPAFESVVKQSLGGSLVEKHAAVEAISAVPAFYALTREPLMELLDDPNPLIASSAAKCVFLAAFGTADWVRDEQRETKLLSVLGLDGSEGQLDLPGVTLDTHRLEAMIDSGTPSDIELAVKYAPLMRNDPGFVYRVLSRTLKSSAVSRVRAACLDSLRASARARDLVTIADTEVICQCVSAGERNVRLAALRLLGELPDDEQVVNTLLDYLRRSGRERIDVEELGHASRALARHATRNGKLRKQLAKHVLAQLPKAPDAGFGDADQQSYYTALMLICEGLGDANEPNLANRLLSFAESFRTPLALRKQAIRSYGFVARRDAQSATTLTSLLERNALELNEAVYAAASAFVGECKKRVRSVQQVYPVLPHLLSALQVCWKREYPQSLAAIDSSAIRHIRDTVIGVREVMTQYEEFAVAALPVSESKPA